MIFNECCLLVGCYFFHQTNPIGEKIEKNSLKKKLKFVVGSGEQLRKQQQSWGQGSNEISEM